MSQEEPVWNESAPATPGAVDSLIRHAGISLPADYLAFLASSNGLDGEIRVQPYWLILWPAEEVLAGNRGYCVSEYAPGFFAFGTSGGGEMYAFTVREGNAEGPIVAIPFIPMDPSLALPVADTFEELLALKGVPDDEPGSQE
jgi:hypothetical protein